MAQYDMTKPVVLYHIREMFKPPEKQGSETFLQSSNYR